MSRIGKKPINLNGATVTVAEGNLVTVKGPKGEMTTALSSEMVINVEEAQVVVERPSDSKLHRTLHGTTRSLLNGMVEGVTQGFEKKLTIIGVGYRAQLKGRTLVVNAGYSHPVEMEIPEGIEVEVPKPTELSIKGIDKQLVGEFSANIRKIRPPEPYKGKGIRYTDEHVRRKEGKKAS